MSRPRLTEEQRQLPCSFCGIVFEPSSDIRYRFRRGMVKRPACASCRGHNLSWWAGHVKKQKPPQTENKRLLARIEALTLAGDALADVYRWHLACEETCSQRNALAAWEKAKSHE